MKCFLSIVLVVCFIMAVFAGNLSKPKTPKQKISVIVKKTEDTVKVKTGGKGACWDDFIVSLKTYEDTRTSQVNACRKNAKKCVEAAVNGMASDAKLAQGSVNKCIRNCAKNPCNEE